MSQVLQSISTVKKVLYTALTTVSLIGVVLIEPWRNVKSGLTGLVQVSQLEAMCDQALASAWQDKATLDSTFYMYNHRLGRPARAKTTRVKATVTPPDGQILFVYYNCTVMEGVSPPAVALQYQTTQPGS